MVKFGFCRGIEPVNYVSHILERFEHYKQYLAAHRDGREPSGSRAYPAAYLFNVRFGEAAFRTAWSAPSLLK